MRDYSTTAFEKKSFMVSYGPSDKEGFLAVYYADKQYPVYYPNDEQTIKLLDSVLLRQLEEYANMQHHIEGELHEEFKVVIAELALTLGSGLLMNMMNTTDYRAIGIILAAYLGVTTYEGQRIVNLFKDYIDYSKNKKIAEYLEWYEAIDYEDERVLKGLSPKKQKFIKECLEIGICPVSLGTADNFTNEDLIKIWNNVEHIINTSEIPPITVSHFKSLDMKPLDQDRTDKQ